MSTQGFKAHGTQHVCPTRQSPGVGQRQAAQSGHAGCTIDQTQAIFGPERWQRYAFFRQRLSGGDDLPAIADLAEPEQGNADVRHMGQIADRSLRRHLRRDAVVKQRQQRLNHRPVDAGFTVAVVHDSAANNGAGLFVAQRCTYPTGVAHQGIAR
ncbi:hypothetical protein D3C80_549790 [compost metagenome]